VGVNIPVYRPNALEALEIAIEAGVQTITTSAGDPSNIMRRVKEAGLKVLHKVSTVEMGKKAEAAGVDGLIAMGFEAGGHVGRECITTLCLIPQLVDAVRIPVVASGGIADARGVVAAFVLGAEGVEMGTRFVATAESPVPAFFKERIVRAGADATVVLGKSAMPIRVLKNRATLRVAGMDDAAGDETVASAGDGSYVQEGGDQESAVMPCGQIAGLIQRIAGVREVLMDIEQGAKAVSMHLCDLFNGSEGRP
jgi:enoyl-[acyl-carrier protein] reductase II